MSPTFSALPRRPGYRELLAVVGLQTFGNQLAIGFWIVYLISVPQSLPFASAVLVWLLLFAVATVVVLAIARRRVVRARSTALFGMACAAAAQVAFATLPPIPAMIVGGIAGGIYLPAFWLPINLLLVRETSLRNRAGRLAAVTTTFAVTAVIAPAMGGFVAQVVGYRALFAVAAIVIASNIGIARFLLHREETVSFTLGLRRLGPRMTLAFSGQGAVDGLWFAAIPLSTFLFTQAALELGLLFALFSLAAGITAFVLGRLSDRVKVRRPFLILGPVLSIPGSVVAFLSGDLVTFAFAVGWLSMTTSIAPSFLFTIAADRMEDDAAALSATREFIINAFRSTALVGGLALLAAGTEVHVLFLLIGAVILLEAIGR